MACKWLTHFSIRVIIMQQDVSKIVYVLNLQVIVITVQICPFLENLSNMYMATFHLWKSHCNVNDQSCQDFAILNFCHHFQI